jgi:hypothetical protein
MRVLHGAIGVILVLVAVSSLAADPTDRAFEQARTLVDRMKVFDSEGMAALTYVRFFERMGVDPARPRKAMADLNEKLKSIGAVYTKFELRSPENLFPGDGQLYIIVPYSQVMEAKGRRVLSEAFFIGVSEDQGENWKFVDGISSTQDNIRMIIPSYSGAPLPPRRQRPLE